MTPPSGAPALRAVLFDFDHTLADLGHHVRWADARAALLSVYRAAGVPDAFLEQSPGAISLYAAVRGAGLIEPEALEEAQREAAAVLDEFEHEAVEVTGLMPGAQSLLRRLAVLGLRASIVTANAASVARAVLEREGLSGAVEVVIGRSEVTAPKPAPEGILAAARALGVPLGECVYVGDTDGDMRAARAAGARAWGLAVSWVPVDALHEAGATEVMDSLEAVEARLEALCTAASERAG